MKGKVCIITGSNSGIGKEAALALAKMGATVVMAVRSRERGEKAKEEIVRESNNDAVDVMICDMLSMESIRNFAKEFKAKYSRLDVLINNAGAFFGKRALTPDGFEMTLALNYLGPVLLTYELLPLLKSSPPSRIVNVSSGLQRTGNIDFVQGGRYSGNGAYANAKLMLTTFTYYLAERLGMGVTANSMEPGFVATNIGRSSGSRMMSLMFRVMRPFQISARKGAETVVYLASSDEVRDATGKCFAKKRVIMTPAISYDRKAQEQLWAKTREMLKIGEL